MLRREPWRTVVRWGISLGVLSLCVVAAFQLTEWRAFVQALGSVAYERLLLLAPVVVAGHVVRAGRWQLLVKATLGRSPRLWNTFSAVMIGYAVNALLPRVGEVVRPYVLSRREGFPLASVLSTVVVERFLDVLTLVVLVLVGVIVFQRELSAVAGGQERAVVSSFVALCLICGVLVLLWSARHWGRRVTGWVSRWWPAAARWGERLLEELSAGVAVVQQPRLYAPLLGWTVALWFCYWLPLYGLFWVFSLPLGPGVAFQLLVISAVAIAVAPTPSGAGVYHVAVQLALMEFFAVPAAEALAYAVISHGASTVVALLLGGFFWLWENARSP